MFIIVMIEINVLGKLKIFLKITSLLFEQINIFIGLAVELELKL